MKTSLIPHRALMYQKKCSGNGGAKTDNDNDGAKPTEKKIERASCVSHTVMIFGNFVILAKPWKDAERRGRRGSGMPENQRLAFHFGHLPVQSPTHLASGAQQKKNRP